MRFDCIIHKELTDTAHVPLIMTYQAHNNFELNQLSIQNYIHSSLFRGHNMYCHKKSSPYSENTYDAVWCLCWKNL